MDAHTQDQLSSLMSQNNPLLSRARIPGETFALPSRGSFYREDVFDDSVKDGEVLVNPMVTLDEIYMRTPDMLLNGTAITKVFQHCVPQIKKPLELFAKDMDFLLICLRKVTYGEVYEVVYTHDCENAKEHTYNVSLDLFLKKTKKINKASLKADYILTLPNGQVITLVPPRYQRVLEFYQSLGNASSSAEDISQSLINSIVGMIDNVDGIEEQQLIEQWLREIPAGYINHISQKVSSTSRWGPGNTATIECKDCKASTEVAISLNPIDFFS